MIHFLYPIWLAAAAAVVVPIVLHLWNDRRGKVVKVGSVALLVSGSRKAAWSRRLTQWLLLAVRCLLLVSLAVLMARPYFGRGAVAKGWVIFLGEGGPIVDSLLKAGWERHSLEDTVNYWEGFRVADREAAEGIPFFLRTPGLAARFAGERPVTGRAVHWEVYTPVDSVSHWVRAAWGLAGDSMRVVEGVSRATGTVYRATTVGRGAAGSVGVGRDAAGSVDGGAGGGVRVDTSVFRVSIYTDAGHREDGKYVKAAVEALEQYTKRPIGVLDGVGAGRDKVGRIKWFRNVGGMGDSGEVRMDAKWDKLVWSEEFPTWLGGLLFDGGRDAKEDRRVLDIGQIAPMKGVERGHAAVMAKESVGTALLVWGIVGILFIFERVLSHGKTKT